MSTVELFRFEGKHQVRTVDIDGRRMAVGADICAALDIKDASAAMARLDDADKTVLRRSDTPDSNRGIWEAFAPQVQSIGLVSEDGATDLVLDSRKPSARQFRRFLTHVVWPQIRDTGSYSPAPAIDGNSITRMELIEIARNAELERLALEEENRELTPKAEAYDSFLDATGKYSVGAVAKMFGKSQNWLFRELRNRGVFIGKGAMRNTPYQRYLHHFEVKAHEFERSNGEPGCSYTTYVQPSGIDFIRRKLDLPTIDPLPVGGAA